MRVKAKELVYISFLVLLIVASACITDEHVIKGQPLPAGTQTDTLTQVTVDVTTSPFEHPHLYFTSEDIPAIRSKLQREPYRTYWLSVQRKAMSTSLPDPDPLTIAELEQATIALRTNAFVYAVSGDMAFGNRAHDYLMEVCTWSYWQSDDRVQSGKMLNYGSGPLHGAVGETYDWIYPLLTEEEKKTVVNAIVSKSLEPARKQHGTSIETSDYCTNRISLAYGGVGIAALAISGEANVDTYSDIVHDTMTTRYLDCIDRDGGWSEGVGYLSFGLCEDAGGSGAIYYAEAVRKNTGENLFTDTRLGLTPDFILYFFPPDRKGESSVFGDQDFSEAFRGTPVAALASRTGNQYLQWYYQNAPISHSDPIGELLFYDDGITPLFPDRMNTSKLFRDQKWAALRTGWNTDDVLVGFTSGPRSPDHNRADRNSFTMDAYGERLIIAPGLPSRGYDDPNYETYYAATVSQNTILVDRNKNSQSSSGSGTITRFESTSNYDIVQGDATNAYGRTLSRFTRNLMLAKEPQVFLVVHDNLTAGSTHTFQFLLHTLGDISIIGNGMATITRGDVVLYVFVACPDDVTMTIHAGYPTSFEGIDQSTSYLEISTPKTTTAEFVVILYPTRKGEEAPTIRDMETSMNISMDGLTPVCFKIAR